MTFVHAKKNKKIRIYCTIVCVFMSVHMQHTLKEVSLAALWTFIHHLCIPTSLLSVHGFFFLSTKYGDHLL